MQQLLMRRPTLNDLPALPALPPGYLLRPALESDVIPLALLMQTAFDDSSWTPARVRRELIDAPDVKQTFVIENEGVPVATASARLPPDRFPKSGYVHWVAAHPAHKGRKLGYSVTLAVLHEFVRLGCTDAALETDDFRLPAIKTYQNLGFQPENVHESHPERWVKIAADMLASANL